LEFVDDLSGRGAVVPLDTQDKPATERLLSAYHVQGDLTARTRLIEENLPLVRALARRFAQSTEAIDDLVQAGAIGLIKAVDGFRAERGGNLGAYAVPTIVGELRRHVREGAWPVRVPAERRRAGVRPLALPLEDDVLEAPSGETELERGEARALLRTGFRALSRRERRVVALRYYRDLSQQRIAQEVGLSQVQISRLLAASLGKMRAELDGS
jgi:RNA polymerase sigma-B factor